MAEAPQSAVVVVLGDLGRSPRMQLHTRSLLTLPTPPAHVTLVGYADSPLPADITEHESTHIAAIPPFVSLPRFLFVVYAPLKVVYLAIVLLYTLCFRIPATPDLILVQNPPSIPVLAVLALYRALINRRARLVVDWHNFGYTILAYSLPPPLAWVASLAAVYERVLARAADGHLCVTRAMAAWLADQWAIDATVLHDRPPAHFARLDPPARAAFLARLGAHIEPAFADAARALVATDTASGVAVLNPMRPALLVSSTSWTADEDFSILLDAMVAYNTAADACAAGAPDALPPVVLVITGRGPLRAHYEDAIAELGLAHVSIITTFLPLEDYPRLLGAADLGVSLHLSSSGLDLPMKVVDMFGAGLPVAAVNFACLDELVVDGFNGVVFDSSAALAAHLTSLLAGFPHTTAALDALADGAAQFQSLCWEDNWTAAAKPLLAPALSPRIVFRPRP